LTRKTESFENEQRKWGAKIMLWKLVEFFSFFAQS